MRFRDDERGQSVQIGAVLLFATLVIAFSSYQAFVVPQQNQAVEFSHNQQVQEELQDLRNAIVSMSGGGSATATSVTLGTTYPSRAVAQNPGPASGSLRAQGTGDERVAFSIRNATADGETGDVWDGSRRSYDTGAVSYDPSYNVYDDAPLSVYEHSVLYNEFRSGTILTADQTVVDGRTISLVAVNGSLDRTSTGATSVDVRPVSSSTETVLVRAPDDDSPVTINLTSRLPASRWQALLSEEDNVRDVTERAAAVPEPFHAVRVTLEPGVTYRLQLTKVGVGTGVTDEEHAYLTDVDGEGALVARGENQRLTLAVRDRYDNPVSAVSVNASAGPGKGSFVDGTKTTGVDGEVTFEYRTTGSTATGTHRLNFTTSERGVLSTRPFDQSRPENVTLNVTVTESSAGGGGSAGAYSVEWADPSSDSANSGASLSSCSADSCTWDVGASDSGTLTMNSALTPAFEGLGIDFAVSNSAVGTVSPENAETGSDGAAVTELTAEGEGTVEVLSSANDDSDVITVHVVNVTERSGGDSQTSGDQMEAVAGSNSTFWGGEGVEFGVRNNGSSSVSVVGVTLEGTSSSKVADVRESQTGSDSQGQHEVFIDSSTSGILDQDGRPYYEDSGTPLEFGATEAMTEDAVIDAGTTGTVSIYAFRNNGGQTVDMSGSTVTVTLHFGDGSAETFTASVP